jgi:gamma-glutamyltranspeptidase/glutathione hydrolase
VIFVEEDFPQAILRPLKNGLHIQKRDSIGATEMIIIRKKRKLEAVADKRGNDSAAGY